MKDFLNPAQMSRLSSQIMDRRIRILLLPVSSSIHLQSNVFVKNKILFRWRITKENFLLSRSKSKVCVVVWDIPRPHQGGSTVLMDEENCLQARASGNCFLIVGMNTAMFFGNVPVSHDGE